MPGLRNYGISGRDSVRVYRSFATFRLGRLLLESTLYAVEPRPRATGSKLVGPQDLAAYLQLSELSADLHLDMLDDEFEDSLAELIDRMAVRPR